MLSIYVEHRLRYDQFTMCTFKIHYVLWVAMGTARFDIAQMSFFLRTFFSYLVVPSKQFGTHEKLSWRVQGRLN